MKGYAVSENGYADHTVAEREAFIHRKRFEALIYKPVLVLSLAMTLFEVPLWCKNGSWWEWESAKVQKAEWPLKLIWGSDDALTPLDAGVGLYWQREKENGRVDLEVVPGGHIPHDDNPSGVNAALLAWLQATEEAA